MSTEGSAGGAHNSAGLVQAPWASMVGLGQLHDDVPHRCDKESW